MSFIPPGQLAVENVRSLSPYVPGKPIEELQRELGLSDIIKLASNENPFGPSPAALEAMKRALGETWLYPDGSGHILKQKLAAKLGDLRFELAHLVACALLAVASALLFRRGRWKARRI